MGHGWNRKVISPLTEKCARIFPRNKNSEGDIMDKSVNLPSRWVSAVGSFNTHMTRDLLGGPKAVKRSWVFNLHNALTIPVVVALMLDYQNFSTFAWVYLALHGTYSLCWLLKNFAFPDAKWEDKVTWASAVFTFLLLATYWIAPFLLVSQVYFSAGLIPANWLIAFCISLHTLGVILTFGSDWQKRFALKSERFLITDGMFGLVRHPNYLGEMMVYASYALLAQHWIPWVVLAYWWTMVFLVNMLTIEASLSRYPQWSEYKSKTAMLIPGIL